MMKVVCTIALVSALGAVVPRGGLAATITGIDNFTIVRNSALFFDDPFTDGLEPPSAPNFPSGIAASYAVFGTYPGTAETGGKLQLNSSFGQPFVPAAGASRLSQAATLRTNIDPANTTNGLKQNHTFSIQGLFDLTPLDLLGNYGIDVFDRAMGIPGDEQLQVDLFRGLDGQVRVRFLRQDFSTGTITIIGQQIVDFAQGDQIMLFINHPTANSSDLTGSFQYFDGGLPVDGITGLGTSTMFRGENWLLTNFFASEPFVARVAEPGTLLVLGTGLVGLSGLTLRRHRR
jgi:hypothetical protein